MPVCPQCSSVLAGNPAVCEFCRFPIGARDPYDIVAEELQRKSIIPGLWTRAYSETAGDESRARALYIQYRVAQLAPTRPRQPSVASSAVPPIPNSSQTKQFGRGAYVFSMIAIGAVSTFLSYNKGTEVFALFVALTSVFPVVLRLRDIGTSGWLFLTGFIPLVNLVLAYFLLSAPTGYSRHRQPDSAMKVVSTIFFIFIALVLLAVIMPRMK